MPLEEERLLRVMLRESLIRNGETDADLVNALAESGALYSRIEELRYELDKTEAENRRLRAELEQHRGENQ
jgi:hypothetical protein